MRLPACLSAYCRLGFGHHAVPAKAVIGACQALGSAAKQLEGHEQGGEVLRQVGKVTCAETGDMTRFSAASVSRRVPGFAPVCLLSDRHTL